MLLMAGEIYCGWRVVIFGPVEGFQELLEESHECDMEWGATELPDPNRLIR